MVDITFLNKAKKFCKANNYRLELVGTAGSIVVSRKFKEREYAVAKLIQSGRAHKFTLLNDFRQIDARGWRGVGLIK